MVSRIRAFWNDQTGASMVEALLAFPIVFFAISAFVEAGVTVHRFNQSAKAVAVGARLAAVSDPLISIDRFEQDFLTAGKSAGDPVPEDLDPISCGAGSAACDDDELERLVFGTDGDCDAGAETGVIGMCDVYPSLTPDKVRVTYMVSGLGYVGRPNNPVVSVRVEVVDLMSDFFILSLLFGLADIEIPPQAATVTSEDLSSTPL